MTNHLNYLKHFKSNDFKYKTTIMKTLKIGTDCSGIEAPIQALRLLNIPHKHIFSCHNDPHVVKSIKANFDKDTLLYMRQFVVLCVGLYQKYCHTVFYNHSLLL